MVKQRTHTHIDEDADGCVRPFPLSHDAAAELVRVAWISGQPRQAARIDMSGKTVVLSVVHPGGTQSSSESRLLDISAGGASVLYPGFLHDNTECVIRIDTTGGRREWLNATVAGCSMLSKGIHRISLQWTELFDIRQFVPSSEWGKLGSQADVVATHALFGKLLAIGINDLEVELLRMLLKDFPIEIDSAPFAGAAIDSLHDTTFDILLVNGDCTELDRESFVTKLREEGFDESVFVLIDRKKLGSTARDGEGVQYLARPLVDEEFVSAIREALLETSNGAGGSRPIASDRANEPAVRDSISTFARHARGLRSTLRATVNTDNTEEARKCLTLVNNTASGFGFQILSNASAEVLKALDATGSAQEAGPAIKRFIRILDRVEDPQAANEPGQAKAG